MKVRCNFCGKDQEINKIHKDYQRLAREPEGAFVCNSCSNRVRCQAVKSQKAIKPI